MRRKLLDNTATQAIIYFATLLTLLNFAAYQTLYSYFLAQAILNNTVEHKPLLIAILLVYLNITVQQVLPDTKRKQKTQNFAAKIAVLYPGAKEEPSAILICQPFIRQWHKNSNNVQN